MATRSLGLLLLALVGCTTTLPYPPAALEPRKGPPLHPVRVAILPFEDAREDQDDGDTFTYGNFELESTDLDRLARKPSELISELLARHLAARRVFTQVILVRSKEDAPEARWLLTGKIRRARGYVEAHAREGDDPHRFTMAEVFLQDVTLTSTAGVLAKADAGWSIAEDRVGTDNPWPALGEALAGANEILTRHLARGPLEPILERTSLVSSSTQAVGFDRLEAPKGWQLTFSNENPPSWHSEDRLTCKEALFEWLGVLKFHRAIGPHVPSVRIWRCPLGRYRFSGADETSTFPATFRGTLPDGAFLFASSLGKSNWSNPVSELETLLAVRAPEVPYVFELPLQSANVPVQPTAPPMPSPPLSGPKINP